MNKVLILQYEKNLFTKKLLPHQILMLSRFPRMDSPCGLAKLAPGPIEIPCEDGGGVGTNDAGEGALRAPLGELAACRFPNKGK